MKLKYKIDGEKNILLLLLFKNGAMRNVLWNPSCTREIPPQKTENESRPVLDKSEWRLV